MIWLAAGNLNGLSIEKCLVLKGRNVMLYPDLGAFEKWKEKAHALNSLFPSNTQKSQLLSPCGESPRRGIEVKEGSGVRCSISTLLENEATDSDRVNGLDIADFIINEIKSPLSSDSQKKTFPFSKYSKFIYPLLRRGCPMGK